jgi:hypothetical protein
MKVAIPWLPPDKILFLYMKKTRIKNGMKLKKSKTKKGRFGK